MSIDEKAFKSALAIHKGHTGYFGVDLCRRMLEAYEAAKEAEQPERCKHGVWRADRCEQCVEQPVDICKLIKAIETERDKIIKVYSPQVPYNWCIQAIKHFASTWSTERESGAPDINVGRKWQPIEKAPTITGEMLLAGAVACSQWRNGKKWPAPTYHQLTQKDKESYGEQTLCCLNAALSKIEDQEGK